MGTERRRPHVLVIDDTPEIRDLFQDVLDEEGYRVTLADAVPGDLNVIRDLAPDLLLLDYSFSGTNAAWGLLRALNADTGLMRLPVVLCTAAHEAVHERAAELNAWGVRVVLKPFELDDLLATLAAAVATRSDVGGGTRH